MNDTQFLRLILTLSAITNQIRVDARRSTYTSSKFGEKFSKIKTRLLEVNYLKTLQWNGGKDKVGINGGRGNLGQNIWVNSKVNRGGRDSIVLVSK